MEMSIAANVAAAKLEAFGSWWMSGQQQRNTAERFRQSLRIASADVIATRPTFEWWQSAKGRSREMASA